MKKIVLAAALAAGMPALASAQDASSAPAPVDTASSGTASGGLMSRIEPYAGVLGGYETFSNRSEFGQPNRGHMNGPLVNGVVGVNVPLGQTFFVGAEGFGGKGFGDIDWEYGGKARAGIRTPTGGLLFVSGGYQWVDGRRGYANHSDYTVGAGVEVGPRDFGMAGGNPDGRGPRLRLEMDTYRFQSLRPMAGVVFGF